MLGRSVEEKGCKEVFGGECGSYITLICVYVVACGSVGAFRSVYLYSVVLTFIFEVLFVFICLN